MHKFLPFFTAFLLLNHVVQAQSNFLDPSFGNAGIVLPAGLTLSSGAYNNMVIQPDGKILVQSVHNPIPGSYDINIALHRFLSDGTFDPDFGMGGTVQIALMNRLHLSWGNDVTLLPNGKILVGYIAPTSSFDTITTNIVQLNPDGSPDMDFGTNGQTIIEEVIPDFGDIPALADIEVQSNGRIVVVYESHTSNYAEYGFRLLRPDGSILSGYEEINWWFTGDMDEFFTQALVQPDDKILVGGFLSPISGPQLKEDFILERFETSTFNDDGFGTGGFAIAGNNDGNDRMYDMLLAPDGGILTGGYSGQNHLMIAKFQSNGALDMSFGTDGTVLYPDLLGTDFSMSMALGTNGEFVVTGRKFPYMIDQEAVVARFLPNGAIDTTFSPDGVVYLPYAAINMYTKIQDVAILPDRRILACGVASTPNPQFMLVRLLPEAGADVWYHDADGDGYGNALDSVFAAVVPLGYVSDKTDCDDTMASVNPGAIEICGNGIDDNCDGISLNDTILPVANCVASIKLQLDSTGVASIIADTLDNGSYDDCGTVSFVADQLVFGCVDWGVNTVALTVTDNSGNTSTCAAIVKISDMIAPIARCKASVQLFLDVWGNATLSANDLDDGSYDNCSIATFRVDTSMFNCQNLGIQPLTLYLEDIYGNQSSCQSIIKVSDEILPVAVCNELVQLNIDGTGIITLDAAFLDAGSFDNCSGVTFQADPMQFTTANIGLNTVTLTVSDSSGNETTCLVTVEVIEKISGLHHAPEALSAQVYPNPSSGLFELRITDGLVGEHVELFNASGQVIWTDITRASTYCFDLSGQETGCYYIRVQSGVASQVLKLTLVR